MCSLNVSKGIFDKFSFGRDKLHPSNKKPSEADIEKDLPHQFSSKENVKELLRAREENQKLYKQLEILKKVIKRKEEYASQLEKRRQESIQHIQEMMDVANKMNINYAGLCFEELKIRSLNEYIEVGLDRIKQGISIPIELSQTYIEDLIEAVIEIFALDFQEKNFSLRYEPTGRKIPIETDPLIFKQALMNLLTKTFARSPKNGKLEIEIAALKKNVEITLRDNGYYLNKTIMEAFDENK